MVDNLGVFIFFLILLGLMAIMLGLTINRLYPAPKLETIDDQLRRINFDESWGNMGRPSAIIFRPTDDMELAIREPEPAHLGTD